MRRMDVVIIGAGGHGRVVLDILRVAGRVRVVGFLDADGGLAGTRVDDVEVLGPVNLLPRLKQDRRARAAIVAIGDNRVRRRYLDKILAAGLEPLNAVHPAAIVSPRATVGMNVVICAGAIVAADATIGDSVIVNTGAQVDHECVVEAGAHLAPGAILAGRVQVGADAFVGLGARVIQCLMVGAGALVAAGAVVVRDVEPNARVAGVPARPMSRRDA